MKAEKLSTEIAALERQSGKAKNAVIKKVLTGKINKLKAELEAITSAPEAKEKIKKAKSKISKMTVKEFASYIKQLAKDPKFSFLKSMTSDEIVRDIKRTAKPVGWRFRGRENAKKPTRKDIKEKNDVYYEGRRNRSDVSRSIKLATGGGVNYNYEGQLPQKAVYSSVDEYLKNAKIGDLIWMGKDVNGFKLANKRDLMKIVELNGDDDFAFSFFGRKGKYTLASNNYDRNVVVVDNKKRENGGGVDINDLDMPVIRTQFEDEEYEYAKGGSIGDSGMITDKQSMFVGKMATITGDLGNMYEVMVLDNGNKRTVLVKKNGISIVSDEFANGGNTGEPHRSMSAMMAYGGEIGEGFLIRDMNEELRKMFPYTFGFTVGNVKKDGNKSLNSSALIVDENDPYRGLEDKDIQSKLFFPQYKRDHDIRFRIYQGGENTYFYFALESENGDQYIGQFGFKDRGDVSPDYVTRFIAFLMEQYGLPFQIKHSVMSKGGSTV
jgi:hypothetical protein